MGVDIALLRPDHQMLLLRPRPGHDDIARLDIVPVQ